MPERATQADSQAVPAWRQEWERRVGCPDDLVRFVDTVGCCTRSPLTRYPEFPSQNAVLGSDMDGVLETWFWKDDLHVDRRLYYTRVFGGHPGFLANELLPAFVAANGAVADELIFRGALPAEAVQIYRLIEQHGPIPSRELKRMLGPETRRAADRVLIDLDRRFIATKTAITGRTLGTYGYVWDLTERWIPEVLTAAGAIRREDGQAMIREHLASLGIPLESDFFRRMLGWRAAAP